MKIRLEPYKLASRGGKAFAKHAGILRATRQQVDKHEDFDVCINWGNSERRFNAKYINNPEAVAIASDKLKAAQAFGEAGVSQPEYTTERDIAYAWYEAGETVCCRRLLRASNARGLTIARSSSSTTDSGKCLPAKGLASAPLYVKYVKKATEYRVHVVGGNVIDIQEKRKRQEVPNEDVDYEIRNTDNGWVFCRDDVDCPECVTDNAIAAVAACGLDFGAVDIGYNKRREVASVYEVNTAPGVEGSTLESYFNAFCELLPALKGGAFYKRRNGIPVGPRIKMRKVRRRVRRV